MPQAAPDSAATRRTLQDLPRRAWLAIVLVAIAGVFWLGHRQGQRVAGYDATDGARERRALVAEVARLEAANARLGAHVAELEMARRLDRDTYGQIERTLGDLQSRLARQSDDLDFYRSIVSPADGVPGLRIQRLAIHPGDGGREFTIEVTLIQAMRQDSIVAGSAQVVIHGLESSRPAHYTVGELSGQPRSQLPFSFRYFQAIERTVTLPEDFQPLELEVRAQPNRSRAAVTQAFTWQVSSAAGGGSAARRDPRPGGVR